MSYRGRLRTAGMSIVICTRVHDHIRVRWNVSSCCCSEVVQSQMRKTIQPRGGWVYDLEEGYRPESSGLKSGHGVEGK
jgi:hypothetical protein